MTFTLILSVVVVITCIFPILGLLTFPTCVIFIFPFSSFSTENVSPSIVICFVLSSIFHTSSGAIIPLSIKWSIYSLVLGISPFFFAYKSAFSSSNFSSISLILYCSFDCSACFSIPFSPNH